MDSTRQNNRSEEKGLASHMKDIKMNSVIKILLLTIITVILWIRTDQDVTRILTEFLANKTIDATCNVLKNAAPTTEFL